jgi:hypothetical protein
MKYSHFIHNILNLSSMRHIFIVGNSTIMQKNEGKKDNQKKAVSSQINGKLKEDDDIIDAPSVTRKTKIFTSAETECAVVTPPKKAKNDVTINSETVELNVRNSEGKIVSTSTNLSQAVVDIRTAPVYAANVSSMLPVAQWKHAPVPAATLNNQFDYSTLGLNLKALSPDQKGKQNKTNVSRAEIQAHLHCAVIKDDTEQHVIWWILETSTLSYLARYHWVQAIESNEEWTKTISIDNPYSKLNWCHQGKKMYGFTGQYQIRLFPYTNAYPGFQTKEQIFNTGQCIALHINNRASNKIKLVVDRATLFYYPDDVVWSTILEQSSCLWKLKTESGDDFNNPNFWDGNVSLIRKYYFPGTLSVELVNRLNAPFEELHECYRTPEFESQVRLRRNANCPNVEDLISSDDVTTHHDDVNNEKNE